MGALLVLSACASYPKTQPLATYDLAAGYRFEQLPPGLRGGAGSAQNSDHLFVVLAFSGGGTRAAALSYGVLRQLRDVRFHVNPETGEPVECTPAGSAKCRAMERSLLDEVDVISSVSGGSFTAAYYALNGHAIFNPADRFHTDFLYYPIQRDLFAQAVWHPQNWNKLRSRVEIAANLYASRVFGNATFADLKSRPRPYVVLNATDMSTGARFEFTQEQFDLLCADLDAMPLARAVAASSAFPGLLNSMTIDSFNTNDTDGGCGYDGPGSHRTADLSTLHPQLRDWTDLARLERRGRTDRLFAAEQVLAYKDPGRKHLHLLDGGLADNIGARALMHGIGTFDRPVTRDFSGKTPDLLGGWSALTLMNQRKAKHVLVVVVNARTRKDQTWDTKAAGPGTPSVINVSSGVPMGNFSRETLTRLRAILNDVATDFGQSNGPQLYGFEIAFDDLPVNERRFFSNLGTNFELDPYEVDCLIDRGGRLLRDAAFMEPSSGNGLMRFTDFARDVLKGATITPPGGTPPECTPEAGRQHIAVRTHYLDIGAQAGALIAGSDDIDRSKFAWGITVRATRPRWGVLLDIGPQTFEIAAGPGSGRTHVGDLRLWSFMGGIGRTWRLGQHEATLGASAGFGLGGFTPTTDARNAYGRLGLFGIEGDASNTWIVKPQFTYWYNLSDGWAASLSASYVAARPTVRLSSGGADIFSREVNASAFRIGIGFARKIF